jgi:hypothetical protein
VNRVVVGEHACLPLTASRVFGLVDVYGSCTHAALVELETSDYKPQPQLALSTPVARGVV